MNEPSPRHRERRTGDRRLDAIEKTLDALTVELGKIRTRLGDRNTTLIYDLDERYLTRKDAQELYVPRKEQEVNDQRRHSVLRDRIVIAVAAGGYLTGLIEFILTRR